MSQKTEQLLGKRKSNTRAALELAIARAVRQSDQQCNGLKAVIIERVVSKPPRNANWDIKGVKIWEGGARSMQRGNIQLCQRSAARFRYLELTKVTPS